MQKIILKLYLKNKIHPLFVCEISNDFEQALSDLEEKLNDSTLSVIRFGQAVFARDEFRYFQIEYKNK